MDDNASLQIMKASIRHTHCKDEKTEVFGVKRSTKPLLLLIVLLLMLHSSRALLCCIIIRLSKACTHEKFKHFISIKYGARHPKRLRPKYPHHP